MSEEARTVVIAQTTSEWQGNLIAEVLRERGVDAEASGGLTAQFRAEAPGMVRVIVPDTQVEKARAAIEAHRQETSEIDWSQVDVGKPED